MKFVPKNCSDQLIISSLIFLLLILILTEPGYLNAQWIQQNSTTDEKLTDVVMLDSVTAIAVGRGRSILRTSDAGKTWINTTIMLSSVVPWNAVSFCNDTLGIAAGDGRIRISYDGGKMWMFAKIPYSRKYTSALFISPGNVYVGDDSGYVHHSIDTANTWTSDKITDLPVCSIFIIPDSTPLYPPGGRVIYALTQNSLFIKEGESEWKNWGTLNFFQGLGSAAFDGGFSKNGIGYIVGLEGDFVPLTAIIRLRPQDSSWFSAGPNEIGELHSLSITDSNIIYTCGSAGKIFSSFDNGDSWILQNTPTIQNLNSISFFDEKHGFAVGDSGTILYTENGGKPKTFTAGYWFKTADSLCKSNHIGAAIRNISAEDVSIDGKAAAWRYKFSWSDPQYERIVYLYYHNGIDKVVFDSLSLYHDCCVMNISEDWWDSDSALAYTEANGGKEFRERNPDYSISAVLYQALLPDSHPYWCITYKSETEDSIRFIKCLDANKKITSAKEDVPSPMDFQLYQNYPNPFNPVTKIKYRIPGSTISLIDNITLKIYDILGNETVTLINNEQIPGEYNVEFNGSNYPSGVYFYVLTSGSRNLSRKMILLR